ncbi:MAG: divisome protein SepX/GlpR, partial [Pseudonocardiaceae bacterium]
GTRFRPGRGGYDAEAAALAARAKYAFRQRVVVTLLLGAVGTVLLALLSSAGYWWAHAGLDVSLIGYLVYLRRQVRIEEEVRQRRAARVAGARDRPPPPAELDEPDGWDERGERDERNDRDEPDDAEQAAYEPPPPAARPAPPPPPVHPGAVAVDLDDEDPAFDELDPSFEPPYRRAAGE